MIIPPDYAGRLLGKEEPSERAARHGVRVRCIRRPDGMLITMGERRFFIPHAETERVS